MQLYDNLSPQSKNLVQLSLKPSQIIAHCARGFLQIDLLEKGKHKILVTKAVSRDAERYL